MLSAGAVGQIVPKHGNLLVVRLVLNGMKLQQCWPGFFEAREAIIQAGGVLTEVRISGNSGWSLRRTGNGRDGSGTYSVGRRYPQGCEYSPLGDARSYVC